MEINPTQDGKPRRFRVSIEGTTFPDVDMNDLELGEKELLENMLGAKFTEEGTLASVNTSGYTAAVILIAWRRADPRGASLQKVRKLRNSQYDVEEVEEDPTPAAAADEDAAAEPTPVVQLATAGDPSTGSLQASDRGSSTG